MLLLDFAILVVIFSGVSAKKRIFKLEGEVQAQNFVYYKILHSGNLLLTLKTSQGDADMYVSDKTLSPDFHPENYELHSATCGNDMIYIPKNFKRPIAVGVYGYLANNSSRFILEMYQMPKTESYFEEEIQEENVEDNLVPNEEDEEIYIKKKKVKGMPNSLWPLLEVFELLFL